MTTTLSFAALAGALLLSTPAPAAAQDKDKVRVAELSPKAEAAIDKGLQYLVKTQNKDGSWDDANPVACTSLALVAFMVRGHFPDREPFGDSMAKGLDFLLKEAGPRGQKGYIGKSMYDHGLATLALCELWGEATRSDEVRDALKKAVAVIVKSQSRAGGWRYQPDGADHDLSITVMQIVALASAKETGILVPDETLKRAVEYVKSCQNANGGFGYRGPTDPSFARSAAGVTALMFAGDRKAKETERGLAYLRGLGDAKFQLGYQWFYYGHYYAVVAMYQSGEADYQAWYPKVRDTLVAAQHAEGNWTGGIPSGIRTTVKTNADSYCTPMAILILGVPYRYLPIYQR